MLKIAITPQHINERTEAKNVVAILENGWHRVHLRHPGASLTDMRRLIEAIPQRWHGSLVLHGHFDLVNEFNLGALHLNRRCPEPPSLYRGALSRSCHTIGEVRESVGMAYVTLSPIFDSISKSGYRSRFSPALLSELSLVDHPPVIALGGVTFERLPELKRYNFSGYAMLGALPWDAPAEEMKRITRISES